MGLFVNKMKTHADNEVSRLAKDIVRNWKAQVTKEAASPSSTTSSSTTTTTTTVKAEVSKSGSSVKASSTTTTLSSSSSRPTVETKSSPAQIQSSSRDGSSAASSPRTPTDAGKDRTVRSDGIRVKTTGNDVRDRCTEMLYQALGTNSNAGRLSFTLASMIYSSEGHNVYSD